MEAKIIETMKKAGKPLRPGEIAEILDMDSKEISKIIAKLKKTGDVISPTRCYYSLPDQS